MNRAYQRIVTPSDIFLRLHILPAKKKKFLMSSTKQKIHRQPSKGRRRADKSCRRSKKRHQARQSHRRARYDPHRTRKSLRQPCTAQLGIVAFDQEKVPAKLETAVIEPGKFAAESRESRRLARKVLTN